MSLCVPSMPCFSNPTSPCDSCNGATTFFFQNGCAPNFTLCSTNVLYCGTDLTTSGVNNGDNLTLALQKIDEHLGSGGSSVWGSITGTITNQTDLINYLSANYSPILSFNNGLTRTSNNVGLGGALTGNTTITVDGSMFLNIGGDATGRFLTSFTQDGSNFSSSTIKYNQFIFTNNFSSISGGTTQINISSTQASLTASSSSITNSITLSPSAGIITVSDSYLINSSNGSFGGYKYNADYSTNYTLRSLIDKNYGDTHLYGLTATNSPSNGQVPQYNGTNITWATVSGTGTVTSVSITAGTNITQSGSPITTSGAITVNAIPSGSNAQLQFNNSGVFGASSNLTWDNSNQALNIDTISIFRRGTSSIYIGPSAGNFTTTVNNNIGIGQFALNAVTSGVSNIGIGEAALQVLTTGVRNVWIGQEATASITTGSDNIVIGAHSVAASVVVSTGNNNILIGSRILAQNPTSNDQLSIHNAIFGVNNSAIATSISTGNIGLYITSPTARLHLPAGTITGGTSPLKINPGVLMGVTENGAIESDGTHLYWTDNGGTRKQLD